MVLGFSPWAEVCAQTLKTINKQFVKPPLAHRILALPLGFMFFTLFLSLCPDTYNLEQVFAKPTSGAHSLSIGPLGSRTFTACLRLCPDVQNPEQAFVKPPSAPIVLGLVPEVLECSPCAYVCAQTRNS